VFRRLDWVKVPTANADSLIAVDCSIDHFSKFVFMKFSVGSSGQQLKLLSR
jgi:hypothetical protein